jgi:CheY-like chemotaxis protein
VWLGLPSRYLPSIEETLARKILLADDSVTAQNMGRKILADAGYEVITVNNGSAALKKIAEQKPDLIVLDVYMPGYSGLEVCQRLKEAQETARVPVLLTVGKLEPFKPEEAKRVRADGFIVKPFEASELLSALSKLEDKIVPRAEVSKPGRFAKVTASIEEGRYDKTVAIEEDLGWKNRISFPSKQKGRSSLEEGGTAAASKPLARPRAIKPEEAKVDLGALAPEGLPKDVTPEEIAALAAAAAQVKGKLAESKPEESAFAAAKTEEPQFSAPVVEPKPGVGFPEGKFEEKSGEKSGEKALEKSSESTHSDLMAAITGLDPGGAALPRPGLGNSFSSQGTPDLPANEPVTMALAAGAGSVADAPRWTAVSIALGKEEAATSLEQEMQKAYAAFAAAVNDHVSAGSETATDAVAAADPLPHVSVPEVVPPELSAAIPAMPAPEAIQTLSTVLGNASTDAIRAAVQELEMVAESFVGEPASVGPMPGGEAATVSQLAPPPSPTIEASAKENPTNAAGEPQAEFAKHEPLKQDGSATGRQDAPTQELNRGLNSGSNREGQQNEIRSSADSRTEPWRNEAPIVAAAEPALQEKHETATEKHKIEGPAFSGAVPTEQIFGNQSSSFRENASAETVAPAQLAAGSEPTKKETDTAATTAAAWASWRRVRESGDTKAVSDEPAQKEKEIEQTSPSQDAAAMAVAAGAEKIPEPANTESDPAAIASIVDSVLADLRPKIFEEISRKMGKKS